MRYSKAITDAGIDCKSIKNTKDIWAIDYMPVQLHDGTFVKFIYDPDYLQTRHYKKTITDFRKVEIDFEPKVHYSKLKIDGGNVISFGKKYILTDKIFAENPGLTQKELLKILHIDLKTDDIIIIPSQPDDFTGHADGVIRFIDKRNVIINDNHVDEQYSGALIDILKKNKLCPHFLPYPVLENRSQDDATGCYINYCETDSHIFFPTFGKRDDLAALKLIKEYFPHKTIIPVKSNEIAVRCGVLNCVTWK